MLPATLQLVQPGRAHRRSPSGARWRTIERVAAGVQEELLAVVHTAKPLGTTEITRLTQALARPTTRPSTCTSSRTPT